VGIQSLTGDILVEELGLLSPLASDVIVEEPPPPPGGDDEGEIGAGLDAPAVVGVLPSSGTLSIRIGDNFAFPGARGGVIVTAVEGGSVTLTRIDDPTSSFTYTARRVRILIMRKQLIRLTRTV
jgi:hypothetical protein